MQVDQVYCTNDYWLDYPRKDRVKIDNVKCLTDEDKAKIRAGESVSKSDRRGYRQSFDPIKYDSIRD
jgi:hypothetical protein